MKILIIHLVIFVGIIFRYDTNKNKQKVEKSPPNFLFILTDDQTPFELSVYNENTILQTPNIDRLAKEGVVVESAYHMGAWSGAVCTPSRHMIMTGRTLWNLPSYGNQFQNENCPSDIVNQTIGAVFNRAGYSTMRTCKTGNSYGPANTQFSVVRDERKIGGTKETGSAWHAKQVLNYLDERSKISTEKKPFFIYFGFSHPHDPRNGTPELLEKYGAINHTDESSLPPSNPKQPKLPENYLNAHPFFHGHPNLRDEDAISGVWKNRDERTVRNELGREYACAENIDNQIGKVLKRLEDMGELENTYIIYTSDHGIALGRHGLMGKQNLYEHTWRVPFMIKGPGLEKGLRVKGNIYLSDVLPTLCDLARIDIPKTVNGTSFKPILKREKEAVRDVMYGVYCGGTKPGIRAVKSGDWKLIKYDLMDGEIQKTQLFNLAENPHEFLKAHHKVKSFQTNLADDPKFANKLKEMESLLKEQMTQYNDPYKLWNQLD